ncbi:MAG: hypothetical protein ACI909_004077 [Planctomycetota bacterium]
MATQSQYGTKDWRDRAVLTALKPLADIKKSAGVRISVVIIVGIVYKAVNWDVGTRETYFHHVGIFVYRKKSLTPSKQSFETSPIALDLAMI